MKTAYSEGKFSSTLQEHVLCEQQMCRMIDVVNLNRLELKKSHIQARTRTYII